MAGVDVHKIAEWRNRDFAVEAKAEDGSHQLLLLRYLEVCNHVMAANRHRFPYRQIWSAGEDARSGNPVLLLLLDGEVRAACVVRLGQAEIVAESILLAELETIKASLPYHTIDMGYVLKVVSAPDLYVADPSQINWDWLQP